MISQHLNRHVLLTKLTAAPLFPRFVYSADFLVFQVNPEVSRPDLIHGISTCLNARGLDLI